MVTTREQFGDLCVRSQALKCEIIQNTTSTSENLWPVVQEAAVEEDLIALIKQLILLFFRLKCEI